MKYLFLTLLGVVAVASTQAQDYGFKKAYECTKKVAFVNSRKIHLECPEGQSIEIVDSFYGYWHEDNKDKDCYFKKPDCVVKAPEKAKVCEGRRKCTIKLGSSLTGKALKGTLKNYYRTAKGVLKAIVPVITGAVTALGKREEDYSSFQCQVFRDYLEVDYRCK